MLSKSLIQFSIDGWRFVPSLLFTWGQTMVEVMKTIVTSLKMSHACPATLSDPNPAAATTDPCLCLRLSDTHGQVWLSLLWGHCSFLLGPGTHKVLFVPSKCLFPSPVEVWQLYGGFMVTSSRRAYAIPKSAAPRAPPLQPSTADPSLHRRHSNTVLAQSLWGLWVLVCTTFSLSISGRYGV